MLEGLCYSECTEQKRVACLSYLNTNTPQYQVNGKQVQQSLMSLEAANEIMFGGAYHKADKLYKSGCEEHHQKIYRDYDECLVNRCKQVN